MNDNNDITSLNQFDDEPPVRRESSNKYLVPASIIFAGILVAGSFIYSGQLQKQNPEPQPTQPIAGDLSAVRTVNEDDHILGNPNAPIVFIEYGDFECPFCNRFHKSMHAVIDAYSKEGTVAWVFRHFPLAELHKKSWTEAVASECAAELGGNEAFWEYADLIFANTKGQDGLDLSKLPRFAEQIGLSREAFNACMQSERTKPLVEEDYNEALNVVKARGTPYTLIVAEGQVAPIPGSLQPEEIATFIQLVLNQGVGHAIEEGGF